MHFSHIPFSTPPPLKSCLTALDQQVMALFVFHPTLGAVQTQTTSVPFAVAEGFGERPVDVGALGSFFIFSVNGRVYSSGSSSSLHYIG